MRTWNLRVDWYLSTIYADEPVTVELRFKGKDPKTLRRFDTAPEAVAWAVKWLTDRGFYYWCDVDERQRNDDTYVTLYPRLLTSSALLRSRG